MQSILTNSVEWTCSVKVFSEKCLVSLVRLTLLLPVQNFVGCVPHKVTLLFEHLVDPIAFEKNSIHYKESRLIDWQRSSEVLRTGTNLDSQILDSQYTEYSNRKRMQSGRPLSCTLQLAGRRAYKEYQHVERDSKLPWPSVYQARCSMACGATVTMHRPAVPLVFAVSTVTVSLL